MAEEKENIFAEFGGRPVVKKSEPSSGDIFSEFGGKEVKKKALDTTTSEPKVSSEVSDSAPQSIEYKYSWDSINTTEPKKNLPTAATYGSSTEGRPEVELPKTVEEAKKAGEKPTLKNYVATAAQKSAEHIGEFLQEGLQGTAEGIKTTKEGLKMTGLIQPTMDDFYKISKEHPDNVQLRGFVKALAGTGNAAMSILTHATPAGIGFTEGVKALEATVPKSEHLTKYLFKPMTSLVEGVNGEELSGTAKDMADVSDLIISLVAFHKGAEAGKALKEKFINGEALTTADVNDAIRSSLEVAKNPEEFQKIAEENGLKIKDSEKVAEQQDIDKPDEQIKASTPASDVLEKPLASDSEAKTPAEPEITNQEIAKEANSTIETKSSPEEEKENFVTEHLTDLENSGEMSKDISKEQYVNYFRNLYDRKYVNNKSSTKISESNEPINSRTEQSVATDRGTDTPITEPIKEGNEAGGQGVLPASTEGSGAESGKLSSSSTNIKSSELLENDRSYNLGEENVDNAIGVVNYSPNLSFVADIPKNIKKGWQKYFKKEGDLPINVFERQVGMKGEAAALAQDASKNIHDFKNAVKEDLGGRLSSKRIVELNEALAGNKSILENLPFKIKEIITRMRAHIDQLSKKFIDEGLVEGELVGKIQKNLGAYLTRSYRALDVPDWASKVPFEVVNRAKSFIRNAYEEKGQKLTDDEVAGVVNELLYKFDEQTPLSILAGGKLGSKDLSILKKRGDIAPEIRALWGEYSDPLVNYAKSVAKMSSLISRAKFLRDVKTMGMDKFLFEKPNEKHFKEIAAEGSKTMSPLNGLYTTPEIKAAFEEFSRAEPMGKWMSAYMKINGFSKYAKTILSFPITHIRNFISNPLIMIRNGNVSSGSVANAAKTIYHELAMSDNKQFRDKYKEYQKLGVVGEGLNYKDIQETIKDANKTTDSFDSMTDGTIKRVLRSGTKKLEKLYEHEDTIYKIYSFESEKAKYKSVFPDMSEEELNKKAAEIVRSTTPTYSEVPKAIRELRKIPLVGTFVSFPYEIIRTTYNNAELGFKELANEKTRSIGAKRIAGTIAALTAYTAASQFSKSVNNVSGQQDDAMRRFVAPWMQNSEFVYVKNDGKGEFKVLDAANSDPHNYLKKPIIAMMHGEDPKDAFAESMKEVFGPFLSEEMLLSKIIDIRRNKTQTGTQVYNEQDDIGTQYADMWAYMMKALEPGSSAGIRKIAGGLAGQLDPKTGKPYDYKTEMINQITGQKVNTINIPKSLSFKWAKLDNDIGEAKRIYNTMLYNKGASKKDIKDAHDRAETAINKIIQEAHKDYEAALKLGVPVDEVDGILRGVRLNPAQKHAVIDGGEYELQEKDQKE